MENSKVSAGVWICMWFVWCGCVCVMGFPMVRFKGSERTEAKSHCNNNGQGVIIYLYRLEFRVTAYHPFHSSHMTAKIDYVLYYTQYNAYKIICAETISSCFPNRFIVGNALFEYKHGTNARSHHNAYSSQNEKLFASWFAILW